MIYDITIIGAGPVGASLALALSQLPLKIALLEANPLTTELKPDHDSRALALTYQSVRVLQEIRIWSALEKSATPITTVHVSDRGHFGFTRIKAEEEKVPALGFVVPAYTLAAELNKALLGNSNFTILTPAKVQTLQPENQGWEIQFQTEKPNTLHSKLVIAADGTHSTIRKLLNIPVTEKDYNQSALVTTISLARDHHNTAYERFIKNGALAMLPMQNRLCGCVWTAPHPEIKTLLHLADEEFLQQLQIYFGYRLGKFLNVGRRYSYPLRMLHATEIGKAGLLLIGNAAHTLHPIAAQGFNLGLGDVDVLAKILKKNLQQGQTLLDPQWLQEYQQKREQNVNWIMRFTDGLTRIFAHEFFPLTLARNSALLGLDLIPPFKRRFAKRLMGGGNIISD